MHVAAMAVIQVPGIAAQDDEPPSPLVNAVHKVRSSDRSPYRDPLSASFTPRRYTILVRSSLLPALA